MSGLLIDVSELAGHPGAVKEISKSSAVEGLSGALGEVLDSTVDIALLAESVIEGVQVSGTVSGQMQLTCSRCLVSFHQPFGHRVDETYFSPGGDERDYQIESGQIDLEPLVIDVVVLGIPTVPLHRPDCKGLCPECGTDLGEIDCGHRPEPSDLRWAPLKNLKIEETTDADAKT